MRELLTAIEYLAFILAFVSSFDVLYCVIKEIKAPNTMIRVMANRAGKDATQRLTVSLIVAIVIFFVLK